MSLIEGEEKGPLETGDDPLDKLRRFDRARAYQVVIAYAAVSLAYILVSDLLVIGTEEHWTTFAASISKGFAFVAVTSILILFLIRRNDRKRLDLQDRIYDLNEVMRHRQMASQMVRLESV